MSLSDIVDRFRHTEARPNQVFELDDPEAGAGSTGSTSGAGYDERSGEYFQIRLSEMYLTDQRRWHREVAPASFLFTDFQYGGKEVRRPFFVSNSLLPEIPIGDDARTLRVRFANISVLGPVPYTGGDVGLFQTPLVDWRKSLFQVFEKLFGAFGPSPVSPWLEKFDSLSGDLLTCLGLKDVTCVLAEHLGVGQHYIPRAGYLAYVQHTDPPIPREQLQVHEGRLTRRVNGALRQFDETDYCLVRVQRLVTPAHDPRRPKRQPCRGRGNHRRHAQPCRRRQRLRHRRHQAGLRRPDGHRHRTAPARRRGAGEPAKHRRLPETGPHHARARGCPRDPGACAGAGLDRTAAAGLLTY